MCLNKCGEPMIQIFLSMNGGGASAIYHDRATRTDNIAGDLANSILAELADCCALPLTLPPCHIMDLPIFT